MIGIERTQHIARERIPAIRSDLLAEQLDDEGTRTLLHTCGFFSDKCDFVLHCAD